MANNSSNRAKNSKPKYPKPLKLDKRRFIDINSVQQNDIKTVLDKAEEYLNYKGYVEPDSKIVCAVSGGVDSSVLLDCLVQLSQKYHYKLFVAHYNHNLRGLSSKKDAEFVENLAKSYNIAFINASGNVRQYAEKNSFSIEHAARVLRYNFFERTTRNLKADFIAMAHTADDSAETFLINLLRGAGLTGLSGIPEKRQFVKNVVLVRPFIDLMKSDLISYSKVRRLKYREDETNSLMMYTRNRIRHELLPMMMKSFNPSIISTINRTAKLLRGADEVISQIVNAKISRLIFDVSNSSFSINISYLKTLHDFLQGEIIQHSITKYLKIQPISTQIIDRIISLADSSTGSSVEINKNHYCIKDRDRIIFTRKDPIENIDKLIKSNGKHKISSYIIEFKSVNKRNVKYTDDPTIEYFDADLISDKLQIRHWKEGDTFTPLGMDGTMKISDFLINRKISVVDKQKVLVLTNLIDIIWVCGMQINDKYKVTSSTQKVIMVKIENINNEKR